MIPKFDHSKKWMMRKDRPARKPYTPKEKSSGPPSIRQEVEQRTYPISRNISMESTRGMLRTKHKLTNEMKTSSGEETV